MTETAEHPETPSATPNLMPSVHGYRLPATALAEDIRREFRRANWLEQSETLVAAHADRAAAEVRAGAPLPLDPHESKGAGYLLDDLAGSRARTLSLRTLLDEAEEAVHQARKALAALVPPRSARTVRALVVMVVVMTLIGVLALTALLSSSFDELLFRSYFEGLNLNDPAGASQAQAERLMLYAASLLLGAKAAAVVGSSGELSRQAKALLIAVAVVFSACLGMVRITPGFSWAAVAVSGIEFALLLSFTVLLLAVAHVLRQDAERRASYLTTQARVATEEERAARLTQDLTEALNDYERRRQAVGQREDDVRRLPFVEAVARATVQSVALTTTLEQMSETARGLYAAAPALLPTTDGGAL